MTVLRALSWNVNGLRAVHKKGFLDWFASENPDILCLQETKLHLDQVPAELQAIEGYYSYYSTPERKGYSGVGLFTKTEPHQISYGFGVDQFDQEGRVIIADYEDFLLFNIYFPNGQSSAERLDYKMKFYDAFLEYVDRARTGGRDIVICGDVNTAHKEIDLARPKPNEGTSGFLPQERAWVDKFLSHGYVDTLRMFNQEPENYTYWDQMSRARERNVGWRIDYFFVNQEMAARLSGAYVYPDVLGSDHCPVGLDINIDREERR